MVDVPFRKLRFEHLSVISVVLFFTRRLFDFHVPPIILYESTCTFGSTKSLELPILVYNTGTILQMK